MADTFAEKTATAHVEQTLGKDAIYEAKHASDQEHNTTFWQAVKDNNKAVFWSAAISMSIVMEGYDLSLIGNVRLIGTLILSVLLEQELIRALCYFYSSSPILKFRKSMATTTLSWESIKSPVHGKLVYRTPAPAVLSLGAS